ncbi:MAG: hypothetical protein Q4F06_01205 [Eubacteriales bacterium]|nr:hypothetical protein [Eubacteriales bacterium]
MLDANTLVKGEDYDRLPESYVIFITENDVMGANLPVYYADRIVSETGKPLGDGTHIVYMLLRIDCNKAEDGLKITPNSQCAFFKIFTEI